MSPSLLLIVISCHFYLFLSMECNLLLGLLITLEWISWEIILSLYWYISLSTLSAGLCGITFLVTFIPAQWRRITVASVYCFFTLIYLFYPRRWVWNLVVITDCKYSNFLSDHIITIYHCFIHEPFSDRNHHVTLYSEVWSVMQCDII